MKAWKKYSFVLICIVLFTVNILLIVDSENNISRLQIIDQLILPVEVDIVQSIEKPAIISSTNEKHIYYNENLGSMGELYVEDEQEVQFGDLLFTYNNIDLDSAKREMELKLEQTILRTAQLSVEIDLLYAQLLEESDSRYAQLSEGSNTFTNNTETETTEEKVEIDTRRYEVEILEKQHQIEELQLEQEIYQQSLLTVSEKEQELQITSPVTGIVKEISTNRNDPFITLLSTPLVVKGEVTETESLEIDEGMSVQVFYHDKEPIDGTLSQISNLPSQEPTLEKETTYPFFVDINNEEDGFKVGYHVDVRIIQSEIPNALTVPPHSLLSKEEEYFVLVIQDGQVEKRDITLGMVTTNIKEVIAGLATTDLIVADPSTITWNHPFVTTLKLEELETTALSSFRKKEIAKLMIKGFVQLGHQRAIL
ncbi:efflux RND transporter periplasmic adaptor subunit [Halalkalibacter lacteus]|uniref:efflux RND transporter periplasmic adaptor subunit n=1 Tax=Halalkalibacter lacteus TaxID=3090663 RepID=UPI002FC96139